MRADHDSCLTCRHALRPAFPAPGQARCSSTGTLVNVSAFCDAFVPADQARRIAEAFRAGGGVEAVRA